MVEPLVGKFDAWTLGDLRIRTLTLIGNPLFLLAVSQEMTDGNRKEAKRSY